MTTKTRLANKTIWALEDIIAHCNTACSAWTNALVIADRRADPRLLTNLAALRHHLAEIDRLARDARHGAYTQGDPHA